MRPSVQLFCSLLLAGSLASFSPGKAAADGAIGFFGALTYTNLSGDTPPRFKYQSRFGGSVGAVGEFHLTEDVRLSFQPMLVQRGATLTVRVPGEESRRDSLDLRMNYVALPVLVKILAGNGKTYVTGGLNVGYLLSAELTNGNQDMDVEDAVYGLDLSADVGFGIMLPIGKPLLTMELRYEQGILNMAEGVTDPDSSILPVRFRSSGFEFFGGLLFPLGGR